MECNFFYQLQHIWIVWGKFSTEDIICPMGKKTKQKENLELESNLNI